ncbi:hypothetical protein [Pseudarthrobacter sp. NamE5]|uniref:hypothetical protein n=1 Tax=Pseudarthrobacter sp. NamE5 TaxID=2576839 RepID=UPI001F10E58E|nr:hypothetical protein [Pseudarthrobacter sp. NamE5]
MSFLFGAVFLAGLVVAQFVSSLATQASASRLLYALGRDSVVPKAVFGRLSEKHDTSVANLVVTGLVGWSRSFWTSRRRRGRGVPGPWCLRGGACWWTRWASLRPALGSVPMYRQRRIGTFIDLT